MKTEWTLTQEAFDRTLAWLDPDREVAAIRYQRIRCKLIAIFQGRGCPVAEELADITFNRVARKVHKVAESYEGDPALYFYGVGKKVYLEYYRKKAVPIPMPAADPIEEQERYLECLERCLQTLDHDSRFLILEYYHGEKRANAQHRRDLAERLGITVPTMRVKAGRIREVLQPCVFKCLENEMIH